jgi:hypothetical protein
MKMKAPKAMAEPFDTNLVSKLWALFIQWLNEYLKLVDIMVVVVLGYVKDEQTFSKLPFMKANCTTSWVRIWTQLFACLHKSFILKITSFTMNLLQLGWIKKSGLELPLSKFYFFHNTRLKRSCFHNLDKSSDSAWFFIGLWGLLTFRCSGWDFELHWAKSDIKLGFNSPSKCVCV